MMTIFALAGPPLTAEQNEAHLEHLALYQRLDLSFRDCGWQTYHRIHKLDAIVFWRIVTGCDHHPNHFAIEFAGSESRQKTYSEHHGIQEIAKGVLLAESSADFPLFLVSNRAGSVQTYAFIRN
jgi:hypothetical protein